MDLSKLANFLKWKWTTVACFASMVIVWKLTRLYVLPFVIYKSVLTQSHYVLQEGLSPLLYLTYRYFFYVLMFFLIVLHCAWFMMFIQIAHSIVTKSEVHDYTEHKNGEKDDHRKRSKAAFTDEKKDD